MTHDTALHCWRCEVVLTPENEAPDHPLLCDHCMKASEPAKVVRCMYCSEYTSDRGEKPHNQVCIWCKALLEARGTGAKLVMHEAQKRASYRCWSRLLYALQAPLSAQNDSDVSRRTLQAIVYAEERVAIAEERLA